MRFMLVLPLLLIGCARAPSPQTTAVRDADQKMVERCEFVGEIMGNSPLGVMFGSMSTANAREIAVEEAASRGATHMVWASITSPNVGSGAVASGKAYRCAT